MTLTKFKTELTKFARSPRANLESPVTLVASFMNHLDETGRGETTWQLTYKSRIATSIAQSVWKSVV